MDECLREPGGSQWSRCIFFICTKYARNIKSVYVEGLASRERLYDQRTKSFQLRPIRRTFSLYHAFSYSLDLEGRTYERGLIAGYCDSLDVRSFPATFTPRQVLSRTTLESQRSGKRVDAWFLPVSTNEAERAIGRKTASQNEQSLFPWHVFQPFDPPLVLYQLPRNYFSLWTLYALTVRASSIIFSEMCQKCKDYSYISFDAFQTWIKRWCRWYLLEKRFRQSWQ